jgi:diguanylate cyclase (GGDEF)-like protein
VKVEPLLNFNLSYKSDFSFKLQRLQLNIDENKARLLVKEMETIVEMAVEQLRNEIESDPTVERDALTKLWNRGCFDSELPHNIAEEERTKQPLSLIMVDIDHFKEVNDTHGHLKGDDVLAGVASCILSVTKNKGRVYRYGGEEIVVILNNYDTQEAIAVAERIRRTLESTPIADISVTASFGVGTFPDHGGNSTEIIKAADTALYDAKNRGRNLVRVVGEPEPPKDKKREPERKLPSPGALTEQQKRELRRQYFMGVSIRCPRDRAILEVHETTEVGKPTTGLLIWCKMCGLSETL